MVARAPAPLLLALVCLAASAVLIALGSTLSFFNDDWFYLFQRFHSVLTPVNGQPVVVLTAAYRGLVEVFGMDTVVPFRVVHALALSGLAVAVFAYLRGRIPALLAVAACAVLLLLGPAWEALLFFASLNLVGSLATGVAALVLLERDTPRRNAGATLLLVASVCFAIGLPFLVGAAVVVVLLRREPRQLWIPGVPAALFAVWWLVWGRDGTTYASWENVAGLPGHVAECLLIGLASLAGVNRGDPATTDPAARGLVVLAGVAVLLAVWWWRGGRPRAWLAVPVSVALGFWVLTGVNYSPGREPFASRYQLVHATLLLLIAGELFRSVRWTPRLTAAFGVLAVLVIASNVSPLRAGHDFLAEQSRVARADLGALELARDRVPPTLQLDERVAGSPFLGPIFAGEYVRETRAHGPVDVHSEAELAAEPEHVRRAADRVLVAAGAPRATPVDLPAPRRRACRPAADGTLAARPGQTLTLVNPGARPAALALRRFAARGSSVPFTFVAPRAAVRVELPADAARRPWVLGAVDGRPLRRCAPA